MQRVSLGYVGMFNYQLRSTFSQLSNGFGTNPSTSEEGVAEAASDVREYI
jgi:hypothetical protein